MWKVCIVWKFLIFWKSLHKYLVVFLLTNSNHSFVVFLFNELRHTHKQEFDFWTCVCASFHFCQLLTDHCRGRASFLFSGIIILFYFTLFCCCFDLFYYSFSHWLMLRQLSNGIIKKNWDIQIHRFMHRQTHTWRCL